MAHMWFGDIVTMRWWDDLWLNESFAEWACGWAAVGSSEFTDMWAGMLATEKQDAYAADAAPTTHPIRQELADVETAQASFDDITYPKGAAVLKQLVAYVGEDAFVAGLRSYFRTHAWGNTTLDDLIAELATASGRDLTGWVEGWLETSGTDRLTLELDDDGLTLVATPPVGRGPLPHRLLIGAYADRRDDARPGGEHPGGGGRRAHAGRARCRGRPVAGQRRRPDLRRRPPRPGLPAVCCSPAAATSRPRSAARSRSRPRGACCTTGSSRPSSSSTAPCTCCGTRPPTRSSSRS